MQDDWGWDAYVPKFEVYQTIGGEEVGCVVKVQNLGAAEELAHQLNIEADEKGRYEVFWKVRPAVEYWDVD